MNAFWYGVRLQWKLDRRNKDVLITYYIVPLVFFLFMGGIFSSVIPNASATLIQSMTIFANTMGAVLGAPAPLLELYGRETKKAYSVGHIPLWTAAVNNFISAFVHLAIVSIIIFLSAPLLFGAARPDATGTYFAANALMIISSLSIGTVLGLFIKSSAKLTMVSQVIFLPSIMLSGIMFPSTMLPAVLQNIGRLFPATWGFRLMCQPSFDFFLALPLIIIIILSGFLCAWQLRKIILR